MNFLQQARRQADMNMEMTNSALRNWSWMLLTATGFCNAASEPYPVKPVRVIAAFSPGCYVDLVARLVAGPLTTALGQQVIVENRAGAGGVVGTELAARAAPDGHTLTVGSVGTH